MFMLRPIFGGPENDDLGGFSPCTGLAMLDKSAVLRYTTISMAYSIFFVINGIMA